MANKRGKSIDTTRLSLDHAEERGFIHRDYIAHCLRWSHVIKYLMQKKRYQTHHVLDIGCGNEVPLPKLMYSNRMTHTTGSYTGVDAGLIDAANKPIELGFMRSDKFHARLYQQTDFVPMDLPHKKFDTVVCLEVLEHVEPYHAYQILKRIREVLKKGGRAFISTPVYDPKVGAADNHVNEMSYWALKHLIYASGFIVENSYGTFASQKDIKPYLSEAEREVFDELSDYYDSNVLACIFAPLHPVWSRNCLWVLKPDKILQLNGLHIQVEQSSSSERWVKDFKKIRKEVKKHAKG